jgi:hypothetical protein
MKTLTDIIRDINNSGYEDGRLGAGNPASVEVWEKQIHQVVIDLTNKMQNEDKWIDAGIFRREIKKL